MKKVLIVYYSQSGQLSDVVQSFTQPLVAAADVSVVFENICPSVEYPFPWPFLEFIDTFPESVYLDSPPIKPLISDENEAYDLVVLAYQVWFLSPSLPITGFLQSPSAQKILKGTPVVTLIACRNMWLMAQEEMKSMLSDLGAHLIGNVALVDEAGSVGSFLATPFWVLSGDKGPRWNGMIPRAGVAPEKIKACDRFGDRIVEKLRKNAVLNSDLLTNLNAVEVDETLISSEITGKRAFKLWGKLFRGLGQRGSWQRKPLVIVYAVFLVLMIVTVVPLGILIKRFLAPMTREKIVQQKAYYGTPSGS